MRRYISVFNGMVRNGILSVLTWRGFFITLILSQVAAPLLSWAIWSAALPQSETRPYYVALLFTQLAVACYEQHTTSTTIYNGDFINILVMPFPVPLNSFSFATSMRLLHLAFASPLLIFLFIWAFPTFSLVSLYALPAILMALILRFLFGYTLALTAFFTQRAFGISALGSMAVTALGGSAVSLLLTDFTRVVRWLPFRYMSGFPAELAAGVLDGGDIALGFIIGAVYILILSIICRAVYRKGLACYKGAEA